MIMGITYTDWDDMDTHHLMFCQTSSENVNQMKSNSQEHQRSITHNQQNIFHAKVGDFILSQWRAVSIDPNGCLLSNQSTCNSLKKSILGISVNLQMVEYCMWIAIQEQPSLIRYKTCLIFMILSGTIYTR